MRRITIAFLLSSVLPVALHAQATPRSTAATQAQAASPASAPTPASRAEPAMPANAMGRVGRALVDAVNSGDAATIHRFVAERLGHDVRGRSPDAIERMLRKLHTQSTGLRVERARMAGSALRIMAHAQNGRRWVGIEIEPATGDSTRASIMLYPTDDPGMMGPPAPWSTETLTDAQLATLIRERIVAAADSDQFSGVILVAHGDTILVHEAVGFADRASGTRTALETRYPTFSLGKMFTGVAIAQLVAEGRLRWSDTLARVLPEYPNADAARQVTVAELLTHTAGVPDPFLSSRYDRNRDYASHAEMLPTFADAPLRASRGSFDYSNGGFATLAAIVERVSGQRFDAYLQEHVFGPSGMRLPETNLAIGYAQFVHLDPLGIEPRRPTRGEGPGRPSRPLGFGVGQYTAEDLFRFARALHTGKLLPAALVDTITTGHVQMGPRMKYGYGFYEQLMHDVRVYGHSGSNPSTGYDADLQMVNDGEWTVVVLSNYDAPAGMMIERPILDLLARQVARRR